MREGEPASESLVNGRIETIDAPDDSETPERNIVASFYRNPVEYETGALSELVNNRLTGFLQASFDKLQIMDGKVLDLGCGSGLVGDALNSLPGRDFQLDGVDISKEMVEYSLREKNYSKGYVGRIEDVVPTLVERGTRYDYSVGLTSFYYLPNPEPVIQRLFELNSKGFSISLDEITEEFIKRIHEHTGQRVPMYNHVGWFDHLRLPDGWRIADQIYGPAWRSPRVEDEINAEVVTLLRDQWFP